MDGPTDIILEKIKQYQKSIQKHSDLRNDTKILSYISKLYDMPVTVAHLQDTGIGRTINSLRKYNGDVGTASKAIVYKWKNMVAREEEAEEAAEAASRQSQSSVDESETSPPHLERKKRKHSTEDKEKKRSHSHEKRHKRESPERRSKSKERENESRNKSHHRKDEKRDSHKSSHSHSKVKEVSDRHRKEDKSKHDKKRKLEDERSPAKKKKYETNDSDSDESNRLLIQENSLDSTVISDDNVQRDSLTAHENSRENTQSPVVSSPSSPRKKNHKSSSCTSRSRDKESVKKEQNGSSSSSKVSSHRDKPSGDSKKSKDTKQSSSSSRPSEKEKSKESAKKPKPTTKVATIMHDDNGIDSGSGASFAEALGMITPSSSKTVFKKKPLSSSPTPSTSTVKAAKPTRSPSSSVTSSQNLNVDLLAPNTKLEPLDLNIIPPIPEITTNYKPLTSNYSYDSFALRMKNMTEDEALGLSITSKTQRTKVYSGNKTNCGFVPSLFQLCVRVLQDNIDALEYTGGVPYEILKPVLERATATQLLNTEYYNPYLIEESDNLWEKHCKRECRGQHKQELESWREMYLRCRDEREAKLRTLTSNIKQSIDKSVPVRQTKLAYVDNAKPPRSIARKQAKYGTNVVTKPFMTPSARLNAIASGSGERVHVPTPSRVSSSASAIKPKKAPLMQKTLALIKSRFRR